MCTKDLLQTYCYANCFTVNGAIWALIMLVCVYLFSWCHLFLLALNSFQFFFWRVSSHLRRGVWRTYTISGWMFQVVSFSAYCMSVSLRIYSHLLQWRISLRVICEYSRMLWRVILLITFMYLLFLLLFRNSNSCFYNRFLCYVISVSYSA